MPGYVFHVMAMGEQIINFTKIGISDNFRCPVSAYAHHFRDLFLRPAKAAEADDNGVSACFLPDSNIGDPCVDCLLGNSHVFYKRIYRDRPYLLNLCQACAFHVSL